MILCIGTTPALQRAMTFRALRLDAVNRAVAILEDAAGKSVNTAKVLKTLGARPVATGFVGGDRGQALRCTLEAKGIDTEFVPVAARTRECVTLIDESAGTHMELVEEGGRVDSADYERLIAVIRRRVKSSRALVMSGTLAPGGPQDFYGECTRLAREAGALSIVDAQGTALSEALEAGPALVKPNRFELAATVGRELKDDAAVMAAMRELCNRGAHKVVTTAGKEPALAFDGQSFWRIRPPRITAVNPIGSGDAFTAGLVWRLVGGDELGEACRWASAVGAANALTIMTGDVNRNDVDRLLPQVSLDRI
jgi:tagatose 6-phosphate kinase